MGELTKIGWTDHTFNGWWGCTKVSPACDSCYAEGTAKRWGFDVWGRDAARRLLSDANWRKPLKWERDAAAGKPGPSTGFARHLLFCSSMADVFEERSDLDEHRERLWDLIEATPHLTWQLLTKRPQNVLDMVPGCWHDDFEASQVGMDAPCWPDNVWIGTTVEDQRWANVRVPRLLEIPAPVRFLSCEPLLGPIDLVPWLSRGLLRHIEWVIVGGESGAHRRELSLPAVQSLRDQTRAAGVPLFVKQDSARVEGQQGRLSDELWAMKEFPRAAA